MRGSQVRLQGHKWGRGNLFIDVPCSWLLNGMGIWAVAGKDHGDVAPPYAWTWEHSEDLEPQVDAEQMYPIEAK